MQIKNRSKERRLAPIDNSPKVQVLSDSEKQQIRRLKIERFTAYQISKLMKIATSLILLVEIRL